MGTVGPNERADDPMTRLRENLVAITSLLVTGFWLAALFTGQSWWLAALLVGYVVVIPLVALLFGDEDDRAEWIDGWSSEESAETDSETAIGTDSGARDARDALETLRERYAAGELTDEQFERKLERLIETETLEDTQDRMRGRTGEQDRNRERDRDVEYER